MSKSKFSHHFVFQETKDHLDRFKAGSSEWNKWAYKKLREKEVLEKAGKWKVKKGALHGSPITVTADEDIPEIQEWLDETYVDFSKLTFQLSKKPDLAEEKRQGKGFSGLLLGNLRTDQKIKIDGFEFDFSHFIFPGDVDFERANFKGGINFRRAEFHGLSDFNLVRIKGRADFTNTKFFRQVSFRQVKIKDEAIFLNTNFFEDANFWDSKFCGNVQFLNTNFNGQAQYSTTVFKKRASFAKSQFKSVAAFNFVEFKKNADFFDVKFLDEVNFLSSKFYGEAYFINSKFMEKAYFSFVDFKSGVLLGGAIFKDASHFEAILAKRAFSLAGVEFTSNIPNFTQANFAESPRLDNIEVLPSPEYKTSTYSVKTTKSPIISPLKWQRYWWNLQFLCFIFRSILRLSQKLFHLIKYTCLKYIYCPLIYTPIKHLITSIVHGWGKFTNTHGNSDKEAHYRALKRLAIQAHDHENEMKFFAGEIRARRHVTDFANFLTHDFASSMRYWAGVAYELFSDFGRSFIRPTLWWFACLWLFANLTLSGAGLEDTTKCHNSQLTPKEAAYTIGLKNSLLILGLTKTNIVKQAELCLYGANKNGEAEREPKPYDPKIKRAYQAKSAKVENTKTDIPFKAAVQGIAHSLLSLLFIFLLLLAIRNQFKIK